VTPEHQARLTPATAGFRRSAGSVLRSWMHRSGPALRAAALWSIVRIREPVHTAPAVTGAQAFTVVWRLVSGKPIRPPIR